MIAPLNTLTIINVKHHFQGKHMGASWNMILNKHLKDNALVIAQQHEIPPTFWWRCWSEPVDLSIACAVRVWLAVKPVLVRMGNFTCSHLIEPYSCSTTLCSALEICNVTEVHKYTPTQVNKLSVETSLF